MPACVHMPACHLCMLHDDADSATCAGLHTRFAAGVSSLRHWDDCGYGMRQSSSGRLGCMRLQECTLIRQETMLCSSDACEHWHLTPPDLCLAVQLESIAGFSAVIDRLGQFSEVVDSFGSTSSSSTPAAGSNGRPPAPAIDVIEGPSTSNGTPQAAPEDGILLDLDDVTLSTPEGSIKLLQGLSVQVSCPVCRMCLATRSVCVF